MSFTAPVTIPAQGTVLSRNGSAIGNLVSISGVGFEVSERKTTDLGRTRGSRRPSLPTGSDGQFEVHYHPSKHATLVAAGLAKSVDAWSIQPPDDDTLPTGSAVTAIAFTAFIKKFEFGGIEEDGTYMATITLAITDELDDLAS